MTGNVLAEGDVPPLQHATLRIRVLDVSYADAPSRVVAEQAVPVSHEGGEGELARFVLEVPDVDPRGHYAVAAEVEPGPGSAPALIASTVRYPVLTHGAGTEVAIRVRALT